MAGQQNVLHSPFTKLNAEVVTTFLRLKLFLYIYKLLFFDNTPGKEICYPLKIQYFFQFSFQ